MGAGETHDSEYAVDLGARAIQRVGDDGQRGIGHVTQLMLQLVKDFEKLIGLVAVTGADGERGNLRRGGWGSRERG